MLVCSTFVCDIWVLVWLAYYGKMSWFLTLLVILIFAVISRAVASRRGQLDSLMQRSFDSFFFGMPLALFCFYGLLITHRTKECEWFLGEDEGNPPAWLLGVKDERSLVSSSFCLCGCITVLSMALAAYSIDCNASSRCIAHAERSWTYAPAHVLFRAAELTSRVSFAVFFCEFVHIMNPPFIMTLWGPAVFLCLPYILCILAYCAVLYWANPRSEREARDEPLAVLVVAITMLGINSLYYVDEPAAAKARKRLHAVRGIEAAIFCAAAWHSCQRPFPRGEHLCHGVLTESASGMWLMQHRQVSVALLVASAVAQYLLHNFHPTVGGQGSAPASAGDTIIPRHSGLPEGSLAIQADVARGEQPGLCRRLVGLGGRGVVACLAGASELTDFSRFQHVKVLASGGYGVVVMTRRGRQQFAMKLSSTVDRQVDSPIRLAKPRDLAKRETDAYSRIWQEEARWDFEDEFMRPRVGHPFIVRLYFYFSCSEGLKFQTKDDAGEVETVRHTIRGIGTIESFDRGWIMEYCEEGSLESYANQKLKAGTAYGFAEFVTVRKFIAQILLALDFLHRTKEVVHRDLNLKNVLLAEHPQREPCVKLADFGFSRDLSGSRASTYECSTCGTPYWYAPEMQEQLENGVPLNTDFQGHLSLDIFSFGTVVFALAHGLPLPAGHMGRKVHPASNCALLDTLLERFPTKVGSACVRELVRTCVAQESSQRPTTKEIRRSGLFTLAFHNEQSGSSDETPALSFRNLLEDTPLIPLGDPEHSGTVARGRTQDSLV